MITIAFDEAGNTGQHLTNRDQPVFVLASVNFGPDELRKLLSIVSHADGSEVKFAKLKRSAPGRRKIAALMSDSLISPTKVKAVVFYKRFMIMAKVIDLLLEPMADNSKIDLYSNGANISLSNMHFYCMPAFCGEVLTDGFYEKAVQMVRTKTVASISDFYSHISVLGEKSTSHSYSDHLALLWATQQVVAQQLGGWDLGALDPAIPAYVDLVDEWGTQLNENFITIHDESKIIAQSREDLLTLLDQTATQTTISIGPRTRTYPLRATDLTLEKSENYVALQIADIVAGSVSHMTRVVAELLPKDDLSRKLEGLALDGLVINAVWPSKEIVSYDTDGTEVNPADTMADYLRKQEGP